MLPVPEYFEFRCLFVHVDPAKGDQGDDQEWEMFRTTVIYHHWLRTKNLERTTSFRESREPENHQDQRNIEKSQELREL